MLAPGTIERHRRPVVAKAPLYGFFTATEMEIAPLSEAARPYGRSATQPTGAELVYSLNYFPALKEPTALSKTSNNEEFPIGDLDAARDRIRALDRDKQRLEDTLRALSINTARYLNLADVILVALDDRAQITMVGGRCEDVLGYNPGELIGKDWFKVCVPLDEHEHVHAMYQQLLSGKIENAERFEHHILNKKRQRRLVAWHNSVMTDAKANVCGVLSSGVDVTERRRTEQSLTEERRMFASLVGNLPGMVYRCRNDKDWTMEYASEGCTELTGYSPSDFMSGRVSYGQHVIHPDDQTKVWEGVQTVLRDRRPYQLTYRIITATSLVKTVWEQGSGVFAGDGELITLEGYITDISDRVRAEDALQETRRFLEKAQQIAHIGSWAWDAETRKYQWSDEMHRIFSITPEEFDGTISSLAPVIHPDDKERVLRAESQFRENGKGEPIEYRVIRKDGSVAVVFTKAEAVFDEAGKLLRLVGTCQDITLARQQEEQIRRSQKMDALGKLTGGIAHDYNNMLGVILGYSKLLQDALADNAKLSKFINEIHRAAERGTGLSRKLLAFSRHRQPEPGSCSVNDVLSSMRDLLQQTLTPRIQLVLDLAPDLWPVAADAGDMEDAVLNLAINAMHAMESGGTLTLRTRNEHRIEHSGSTESPAGDYVMLTVSDTGCGMDTATAGKIFDPFFTTKGNDGIGLGLSMVYGFMQRCGGEIKVTTSPGKGSVFWLHFPRHSQSPAAAPAEGQTDANRFAGNETILVVDDEPALLDLAEETLAARGYRVFTAASGEQALKILETESIDLMLSDVVMPLTDGYRLAARVERSFPTVKIQLVSGYSADHAATNVNTRLSQSLLRKPFTSEALLRRVRERLDERSASTELRPARIMIMDDDENVRELFRINLEKLGYDPVVVSDGNEAIARYERAIAEEQPIDACILDIAIPGQMDGKATARELLFLDPRAKLIVSSGDPLSPAMTNFSDYGFRAAIEKNFDREEIARVLREVMS